ncbi:hypothetical protein pclt_cds_702 [Pandoravirus celtis]|uniref:Uncharacterized protein n=1 Tax=Pandoravirus celtis TaxID=2568002 RepID=A0A4D6EIF2_9VIRU|nr:hypothetical protein pclt_cds_702 [Pandoravirus celtis]
MKKSSNTSDSTPTTASPRAFVGDTYDWPNFVKYKSGTTLEKADDLAQVHFCIENRATFPARRGWTAAVIKRQCGPVWKDMDEGKLGTTLRKNATRCAPTARRTLLMWNSARSSCTRPSASTSVLGARARRVGAARVGQCTRPRPMVYTAHRRFRSDRRCPREGRPQLGVRASPHMECSIWYPGRHQALLQRHEGRAYTQGRHDNQY